jgi:hypothetical protein
MNYLPFEPIPGPAPGEVNFVVRVPNVVVSGPKMPVPGVTRYKDFPFTVRARNNEAWTQDYVFAFNRMGGPTGEGDGGNLHEFVFTRARSLAEMQVPVACLTHTTSMPHLWHPVIQRMGFIEDATQPLALQVGNEVVNVPRVFERFYKLPGGVYATEALIETFLSAVPFPHSLMKLDIPVPTTVSWQVRNSSDSVVCLHPHIRFLETQTSGRVMEGMGTYERPIVMNQVQDFPATNHVTWQAHVADEDVNYEEGVWRMVRTTLRPPGVKRMKSA